MLSTLGNILFHSPPPDWSLQHVGVELTAFAVALLVLLTGVLLSRKRRARFAEA